MFLDINEIAPEGTSFDTDLAIPDLDGGGRLKYLVSNVHFSGRVLPVGTGGELKGRLTARVGMECSRCAEPLDVELDVDVILTLVGDAVEFATLESRIEEGDASLFYTEGGRADLKAISTEQIYLGLPLKPVCSNNCKGLCPECGANRNDTDCDCREESIDPRLAPLLKMKHD